MRNKFTLAGVFIAWLASSAGSTAAISDGALDADVGNEARLPELHAPSLNAAPSGTAVEVTAPKPSPKRERTLSANPLWAVPLKQLSETRDRPIFSPSRRPSQVGIVRAAPAPAPRRDAEPPPLSLVGTIAGDDEGFGIFLDRSAHAALWLKTGQDYRGWTLRSVRGREAVMEKDRQHAVLTLPEPGQQTGPVRLVPADTDDETSAAISHGN